MEAAGILRHSLGDASLCIVTASSEESGKAVANDPVWKNEKRIRAEATIATRPREGERERNGGREKENKRGRDRIKRVLTQIRHDSTPSP